MVGSLQEGELDDWLENGRDGAMAQSYSRTTLGIWPRAREAVALYRFQRADAKAHVPEFLDCMKAHQVTIERHLGEPLCGKTIFEIGPGQMLKQSPFFWRTTTSLPLISIR